MEPGCRLFEHCCRRLYELPFRGLVSATLELTNAPTVIIVYADWCGPCKQIAPTFESLSTKYSKPKKISFCKVDVDSQGDVAQMYNVRAMPTFLILRNGTVINTIQGANPPALIAAVEKAVKLAGPGGGQTFTSGGHRLGGTGVGGSRSGTVGQPLRWDLNNFVNMVISFIGIYLVSLFSVSLAWYFGCLSAC